MQAEQERLVGRFLVIPGPQGEPYYALVTDESQSHRFVEYMAPNGERRVTTPEAIRRLVDAGKVQVA